MPTATPLAEPVHRGSAMYPIPRLARELPPVDQPSGRKAPRTATRRTDERGQPLSIFTARRQLPG